MTYSPCLKAGESHPQTPGFVDQDYSGQAAEATIKNLLLAYLRKDKPDIVAGFIRFANVKGSKADTLARRIYQDKAIADRSVSWQELKDILEQ